MKKRLLVLLIVLVFIIGCTEGHPEEMFEEEKETLHEPQHEQVTKPSAEQLTGRTIIDLREEFDMILSSDNWLDQEHYDRILADLGRFESEGEDVSDLRAKLKDLNVAGSEAAEAPSYVATKGTRKADALDWVPGVFVQPLPEGASTIRLVMPASLDKVHLTWLGGFGDHSGAHLEGLDHEWIYVKDGTPVGSWADGTIAQVMDDHGSIRIIIDYGDGLWGQHMDVKEALVQEGDQVKAGDPICYGVDQGPGGYHHAEFYLVDQNRADGVKGIYVPDSVAVSPFDYLEENAQRELIDAYKNKVLPFFERGESIDNAHPWEPYLTNRVLLHRAYHGTLVGEWFLYDTWVNDGIPDTLVLLPSSEYYDKQRILAADHEGHGRHLFQGDWEVDGNKIILDTNEGKYYGIFELDESSERALLKIEYQKGGYPSSFSSDALTYIERDALESGEDGVSLGLLER